MKRAGLWVVLGVVLGALAACGTDANDGGPLDGGDAAAPARDGGGSPPSDGGGGDTGPAPPGGPRDCAEGYRCWEAPDSDVVWVLREEGNVNGPTCSAVCRQALQNNCAYHACDQGRAIEHPDMEAFEPVAGGLGFTCRAGGCWDGVAPGEGMYLVSIEERDDGTRACYFPDEAAVRCDTHPGNANCFGERYSTVCPCVVAPLDGACEWSCPPTSTTRAVWKTEGTSCLARINYWRMRACEEGWVECPPAGLPPMVECTACHECANSEADHDQANGAHASFRRCGENAQGEGGGATCADVIDSFVAERAPDEDGVMRCQGHCGPIVRHGCQSFSWGKDRDTGFHTLNWGGCNAETCQSYCDDHPGDCYTVETSPSGECDDPDVGAEDNPVVAVCE